MSRIVGFAKRTSVKCGAQVLTAYHEVLEAPDHIYDALRKAHGPAICDLTPRPVDKLIGISRPRTSTTLRCIPCPDECWRQSRLTVCSTCSGAEKVIAV